MTRELSPKDKHRSLQATKVFKFNLQSELNKSLQLIYNKVLQARVTFLKQSSHAAENTTSLKQASKYSTVDNVDDKRRASHPAHRCDADLPDLHGEDGTHSTVHPGGSGCPIQDAQTSSKSSGI